MLPQEYMSRDEDSNQPTLRVVETAILSFMFGCLFSIFHHAIKNVQFN